MAIRRLSVMALLCFASSLPGEQAPHDVMLYGAEVIHVPVGARQTAMGTWAPAVALDAVSSFTNPAASAMLHNHEVRVEGAALYGGMSRNACFAVHIPLQREIGISALYTPFFSGDIFEYDSLPATYELRLNRPDLRADGTSRGIFHNNHHRVGIAVGKNFGWGLPRSEELGSAPVPVEVGVGGLVSGYWQTITPGDKVRMGLAMNLDLGAIISVGIDYDLSRRMITRSLLLGGAVRNILPTRIVWAHSPVEYREPIPHSQHLGIGYTDKSGFLKGEWIVSAALRRVPSPNLSETDSTTIPGYATTGFVGIEGEFWESVAFRFGMADRCLTIGTGIRYRFLRLDYALSFDRIGISPVRLSAGVVF